MAGAVRAAHSTPSGIRRAPRSAPGCSRPARAAGILPLLHRTGDQKHEENSSARCRSRTSTVSTIAHLARCHAARMSQGYRGRCRSSSSRAGSPIRRSAESRRRQALRAAAQAARQAAALGARGGSRVPRDHGAARTPACRSRRPIALCQDESVIGTAFYIMDYVAGRVLWDPSLPGMSRERARRHLRGNQSRHRAAAQSGLSAAIGLGDYGKPGSYLERQIGRWTQAVPRLRDRAASRRWSS